MKLKTLYEIIVSKGMQEDQRPKKEIEAVLTAAKKKFKGLSGIEKATFDKDNLFNPYADTRILYGTGDEEIKNVMVGIDIDVSELVLADRLREKGTKIDLVISHHPSEKALANLDKVMGIQSTLWEKYGLSKKVAEGIMKSRKEEVSRGLSAANHSRTKDAAKLLGIPFMCAHTVADNCVAHYLQSHFNRVKPKKLKNVVSELKGITEYKQSMKIGAGPTILIGKENDDAGKIFVDMTGGTSGPEKMFSRLQQAGVMTIVGMHCKESSYKLASSEFINYVIAGHISSDNLGMNLIFDAVEKKEKLMFIECSGFRRVRRNKK